MCYDKKIEKIKKAVERNLYPPNFESKRWEKEQVNSYAYALDLKMKDKKKQIFFPGGISSKDTSKEVFSSDILVERIIRDLYFLGFMVKEEDKQMQLAEGEYRIAIYFIPANISKRKPLHYHFVRQDNSKKWSHKPSIEAKAEVFLAESDEPPSLEKYGYRLKKVLIIKKR